MGEAQGGNFDSGEEPVNKAWSRRPGGRVGAVGVSATIGLNSPTGNESAAKHFAQQRGEPRDA